jgi:hypothetical protein
MSAIEWMAHRVATNEKDILKTITLAFGAPTMLATAIASPALAQRASSAA